MTQMQHALALAAKFNQRFTSSNDVDVSARITVPRDEWRELYAALKAALSDPALLTQAQEADIISSGALELMKLNKDAALAFLKKNGFLTPGGNLAEQYGGPATATSD